MVVDKVSDKMSSWSGYDYNFIWYKPDLQVGCLEYKHLVLTATCKNLLSTLDL